MIAARWYWRYRRLVSVMLPLQRVIETIPAVNCREVVARQLDDRIEGGCGIPRFLSKTCGASHPSLVFPSAAAAAGLQVLLLRPFSHRLVGSAAPVLDRPRAMQRGRVADVASIAAERAVAAGADGLVPATAGRGPNRLAQPFRVASSGSC